jgi:hypothetical protein
MNEIKKGDAVTRYSYNHDIVFLVKRIIKLKEGISNKDKNNLNIKKQVNMVIENFDNDKCK